MFSTKIYEKSPVALQELMINSWAFFRNTLREGKSFDKVYKIINDNQWLSRERLKDLQLKKLRYVLKNAQENVPYYRRLFNEYSLNYRDINSLDDIKKIPFLTKKIIRENGKNIIANNWRGKKWKGSTSGTTGTSIDIYYNLASIIRENAFVWRQLEWAGFKKGEKRVWIRGDMIVPTSSRQSPFWRFNYPDNMLMMSAYHLSNESVQLYLDAIYKFDPVLIQAHPSAIFYISRYLEKNNENYKGRSLRAILTSSETLTDIQRESLSKSIGCPIFDWYGSYERVISIGTCEKGSYHLNLDYGLMELEKGISGLSEIVGTGFINSLMPFIRYKTNDYLELDEKFECKCGRAFPVIKKILGRTDDYIKTKDGRFIGRLSQVSKGVNNICEAQIVQNNYDEILINIVPYDEINSIDIKKIKRNAHKRIGNDITVRVNIVDSIPRTKNGKFRYTICNVK